VSSDTNINNLLGMARTAELGGNTQEATNYYNRVLEIDPGVYEAWIGKGKAAGWQSTLVNFRLAEMAIAFTNAIGAAPAEEKETVTEQIVNEANKIVVALYGMARGHLEEFASLDNIWPTYLVQIGQLLDTMDQVLTWLPMNRNTLENIVHFCKDNIEGYSYRDQFNNNLPGLHGITPQYEQLLRMKLENAITALRRIDPSYTPPAIEKKSADACFVVTATMGDFHHPRVTLLRRFRDDWILKQSWGEGFVRHYYAVGPKVAGVIAPRPILRSISYRFLVLPASWIATRLLKQASPVA